RGHLHELADQAATLRTLIKNAWRIDSATDASRIVNRAFRDAAGGRPGPTAVEMCWDTMAARAPFVIDPAEAALPEPAIDEAAIDAAVRLLAAAKRPMITRSVSRASRLESCGTTWTCSSASAAASRCPTCAGAIRCATSASRLTD